MVKKVDKKCYHALKLSLVAISKIIKICPNYGSNFVIKMLLMKTKNKNMRKNCHKILY